MRAIRPLTSVLDAVYAPEPRTEVWLEGIRASVARAFDGCLGVQAFESRFHSGRAELAETATESVETRGAIADAHRGAEAPLVARVRAGVFHSSRHLPPEHPSRQAALRAGIADQVAAIGLADPAHACVVSFSFAKEQERLPRQIRSSLSRLSAHLAAAQRLRLHDDAEDATLSTTGALLHAEGEAKERARRLKDAVVAIARARRDAARDPMAGLAFWTAMVDGRWTLVERFDADGKRYLVAKRNDPRGVAHVLLHPKERAVLERAALGGSLRHVAYELGLPVSSVSETLARAMKKLGVRSRAELVDLHAALVRGDASAISADAQRR